jgi:hypothetical protein
VVAANTSSGPAWSTKALRILSEAGVAGGGRRTSGEELRSGVRGTVAGGDSITFSNSLLDASGPLTTIIKRFPLAVGAKGETQ